MNDAVGVRQPAAAEVVDARSQRAELPFVKWFSPVRKLVIAIIGGTVLLIGIALIVLPGPAFIVIPIGLAILATEFAWAGSALARAKAMVGKKPKPEKTAE